MHTAKTEHHALPHWLVVGFSGHRSLADPDKVQKAISHELNQLTLRSSRLAGVCSAASGGDTLFAEEMLRRECPLTVVLPFGCERFKRDFDGHPRDWERALAVIQLAREVDVVHSAIVDQDVAVRCEDNSNQSNDVCDPANLPYMDAGYRTIDRADVLLAVWNEKEGKGPGGTADAVRYAIAIGLPLIIINPENGK